IAARRLCDTRTWGIDCDTTLGQAATITLKMGPYETLEEAIAAYCATLQPATIRLDQLSDATWAVALDGAEHRIQNAPGC
ncbi:MAG: hypothetical protein HY826_11265, partial [Actinobacteria bacterium]|nr:hypothetical protein [Actinomycetota bacterium]